MNIKKKIEVLKETIAWFKKKIEPHDCGWMHTTIDGIKHRGRNNAKDRKTTIQLFNYDSKIYQRYLGI